MKKFLPVVVLCLLISGVFSLYFQQQLHATDQVVKVTHWTSESEKKLMVVSCDPLRHGTAETALGIAAGAGIASQYTNQFWIIMAAGTAGAGTANLIRECSTEQWITVTVWDSCGLDQNKMKRCYKSSEKVESFISSSLR